MTAKIKSTNTGGSRFYGDLWVPFSFLMFNLWDFVGRSAAGWKQIIPNTKGLRTIARGMLSVDAGGHIVLVICVFLRLVFVPLFLFCNVAPGKSSKLAA